MIGELTAHVWQSTLFAVAAGLLTVAFRKNRAKVRYWMWLSASLKFFVPFSLLMSAGGRLGWTPAAQKIATPDVSFAIELITRPLPETVALVPAAPGAINWIPIAMLVVWACGFLAIGAIRFRLWLRIRAVVRSSTPMEIPAAVEIRSSPSLLEPGVVGLLRPILLLPEGIMEHLTPSQLEAVLSHELCHVRRRDNLLASIHMVVEAVFWFHPLVWWIGARLVEERERACDEGVLSLGNEPRIYADAILNVCKLYVETPLVCVSGVTGADLKQRIEAILANRTGQRLNRAKKFLLAGAGVAALAGPIAIGVVIGVGHAPAVRAQATSAIPRPVQIAQAVPNRPVSPAAPAVTAQTAPARRYPDGRLLAVLFDFDTMTPDEQTRVRQSAIQIVRSAMKPADVVAVMVVNNGKVAIAQDFTNDRVVLESAMLRVNGGAGNSAVLGVGPRLSSIGTAAELLAAIPEKKMLVYFSSGIAKSGMDNQADLQRAIATAQKSNVAVYSIDARGIVPQNIAQSGLGDATTTRTMGVPQFQPSSAMGRIFRRYGPPDQVDDRSANAQNPSQIWRYNYLENFRSHVEFEFTAGNGPQSMRINWPPPLTTYEGAPGGAEAANHVAGLPGRHASFQIYPTGEAQSLSVPLDSLSGRVDIIGEIKTAGQSVATVRDNIQASAGTFQANFILPAGAYVCSFIVREQATGRVYGETISFEVK